MLTAGVDFTITRNEIFDTDWKLTRVDDLSGFSMFSVFCCGDGDLEEFIRDDAAAHQKELVTVTYVLRDASGGRPVAFVSYCNDSIPLANLPKNTKKLIPRKKRRYSTMPAVKIARLGVSSDVQGKTIGTLIINMTKKFFTTENRTGCRFLTVDAYNRDAVLRFYMKNDFQFIGDKDAGKDTRIMFLDLRRLV